jgi:hypothetical protein
MPNPGPDSAEIWRRVLLCQFSLVISSHVQCLSAGPCTGYQTEPWPDDCQHRSIRGDTHLFLPPNGSEPEQQGWCCNEHIWKALPVLERWIARCELQHSSHTRSSVQKWITFGAVQVKAYRCHFDCVVLSVKSRQFTFFDVRLAAWDSESPLETSYIVRNVIPLRTQLAATSSCDVQ